jgi:purine-binding chemotaxis protein CheW
MSQNEVVDKPMQFLTFNLIDRPYGVPIGTVREINRFGDITPVPGMPAYLAGVMNLRGKVVPVMNLRVRFGMPMTDATRETCIIVNDTEDGPIGIIVDKVCDVVTINGKTIEPAPSTQESTEAKWIQGIAKSEDRVILLIDIKTTLAKVSLEYKKSVNKAAA